MAPGRWEKSPRRSASSSGSRSGPRTSSRWHGDSHEQACSRSVADPGRAGGVDRRLADIERYWRASRAGPVPRLQTLLRQPSVSVDGEGAEACAYLFADLLRDVGFPEAEVVPTAGLPGVWGAYEVEAPV